MDATSNKLGKCDDDWRAPSDWGTLSSHYVTIQEEDVRCVGSGEISLMTALLRVGIVNEMITWERYVRRGVTR